MAGTAPIVLFIYNRPEYAARALASLAANPQAAESDLIIYADGPKKPEHEPLVQAARVVAHKAFGFRSVHVIERDGNLGLAKSVIAGVTETCDAYGRAIVVEDDLVVAPGFLKFMNVGLERYEDEERVMQVSGYMFPDICNDGRARFLPLTTTWGWGVWRRSWRYHDQGLSGLAALVADPHLRKSFDLNGAYDYFEMARRQKRGSVDSWGIAWYLSVFTRRGLVLYPGRTLVMNAGFDGSGTHGAGHAPLRGDLAQASHGDEILARDVKADLECLARIEALLRSMKPGLLQRAKAGILTRAGILRKAESWRFR